MVIFTTTVVQSADVCSYTIRTCTDMDSCGVSEKQYKCQVGECLTKGKAFTTELSLSQHMKSYHHMGDMNMCSICAFTTHDKNTFRKHILKHEKK